MKCNGCGAVFEGKFCPECGNPASEPVQGQNSGTYNMGVGNVPNMGGKKKKKPFYKKPWFLILAIVVILVLVVAIMPGKGKKGSSEKIDWSEMELGNKLPTPPSLTGKIWTNTEEELKVDLDDVSDDEYSDYVDACEDIGYTVDADKTDWSYEAYNEDGYKVYISHINDGMDITLNAPMEFTTITWPNSVVGNLLPAPKSLQGKFSYERDTSFFVYIGETTPEDYAEYVQKVQDAGFTVNYDKGDTYYYSDNADGYHVSVKYVGFNIMSIGIDSPSESADSSSADSSSADSSSADSSSADSSDTSEANSETTSEAESEANSEKNDTTDSDGLRADFKAAMDSYEEFMDKYIEIMQEYQANPNDATILHDYTEYMTKYAECMEAFENWESEDLNDAELAYYLEVQTRVSKKLIEASTTE